MSETIKTKDNDTKESKEVEGETVKASPLSSTKVAVKPKLTENELSTLDYNDFSTPARMLELGKVLAKSKLVPLKEPEDVVVALMTGKELGLPFVTSVSQIYPINGRPTLGVHIQKALCLKQGIIFETVENAEPIYQFVECDKEGKVRTEVIQGKNTPIIVLEGNIREQPENTKKREITKRTKIKATRLIKREDGSFKEIVAFGEFSLLDALQADLLEREVWKKYWKRMLQARAYTNVIKEIASDITLGLSTPMELSNDFSVDASGNEVRTIDITEN